MKTTYVLFVPGGRAPTVYHESLKSAREEASRLIEHGGASDVMVCRFIEGTRKKVVTEPMAENPLQSHATMF